MSSLYPVAFTIKFRSKSRGKDFRVMGLEGQWDVPEDTWGPSHAGLAGMPWKLLIRVPEFVTARDVRGATLELKGRGKPLAASVRLETIREGRCVQALHVGPYAEETRTVARLVEAARRDGYSLTGPHHELYLSDPRRVPADRLRTILRYPVRR